MFGSEILEIAIGLAFVYMILSLACTVLNEWIAMIFATRAKALEGWVKNLINNEELQKQLYRHPLIAALSRQGLLDRILTRMFRRKKKKEGSGTPEKIGPIQQYLQDINKMVSEFKINEMNIYDAYDSTVDLSLRGRRPSYIPPRVFATALLDILAEKGRKLHEKARPKADKAENRDDSLTLRTPRIVLEDIKVALGAGNRNLHKVIFAPLEFAGIQALDYTKTLAAARVSVEQWFDDSMDRLSGWYKRKSQLVVLALALITCLVLNADTIMIVEKLSHDDALRASIVAAAEARVREESPNMMEGPVDEQTSSSDGLVEKQIGSPESSSDEAKAEPDSLLKKFGQFTSELDKLGIPIGWLKASEEYEDPREFPTDEIGWLYKILGLLCTVLAVSLGAPFWFDVLKRIVNLRSSGVKVEKAADEKRSKERGLFGDLLGK